MNSNISKLSILAFTIALSGCQSTLGSADNLYNQYRAKPNNKAFSIGTNNVAGAAWGATSEKEAIKLAQKTCINSGGFNCNVTEVNGKPISDKSVQDNNSTVNNSTANNSTVNNYNIISQGVSYKPNLDIQSSGFFVNKDHIITTSDMIDACSKINYERAGRLLSTTVIRVDKTNNIAVLKASSPNQFFAQIASSKQTKQGERTYTYGYDLSDVVNSQTPTYQGKITDGIISSASGKYNDIRVMRITNEVNTGNIGGPVISENGEVIGLVSNKNQETIKASMLSIFLNELNIKYSSLKTKKSISPAKIAEDSEKFSVPLVCLNEA